MKSGMRAGRGQGEKPVARRPRPGGGQPVGWIYGRHAALAAIANPQRRISRIVAVAEMVDVVAAAGAGLERPPAETVARPALTALLASDAVHQGLAVLAEPLPALVLEDVLFAAASDAIFVVLDQATDPRNVGAVLRAAAAFAATAVVVQDRHAPTATGVLAKAASGALEQVPLIAVVNIARALRTLQAAAVQVIGFDADSGRDLAEVRLDGRVALVFGAEGAGVRRLVEATCDALARIPIAAGVDSLNLGTAAAIALYETARRRRLVTCSDVPADGRACVG